MADRRLSGVRGREPRGQLREVLKVRLWSGVKRHLFEPFDVRMLGAYREQITAIIDRWERAWNSHDMHALAALFHEDGFWILWTGEVWKGRTAIEEGHAAVHKTVFRNSVQRERLEELTFVARMPRL